MTNKTFGFVSFMSSMRLPAVILFLIFTISYPTSAQVSDPASLSLERIFGSREFIPQRLGGFRWLSGSTYARLEPSAATKGAMDLVSYNIENQHREVLISAEKLIPAGSTTPLSIEGYDWSPDGRRVLIYTNSKKVWRLNTKGDYWLLEKETGRLTKIGGEAQPSTLMFAKFSPDGQKIGYVHDNDLYVQNMADGRITRLTADGSHTLINGTSDWVNEEEFELRDCWRWSPDSRSIAFWQFNAEGIEDFILLNNTTGKYPSLTRIPYPKTGTTNSAVRIGVVSAGGGTVKWLQTPGDLRNNYIVSVDWTNDSGSIVLQHLNRLQNKLQVLAADAATGTVKTILTETDAAWIDVDLPKMSWLEKGRRFLWISERDGWKHVYKISADGQETRLITPGDFDVIGIQSVDEAGGWLYYTASPGNATRRYLFRTRLDGQGTAERVTPEGFEGWNIYQISPDNHWAVQTSSSFSTAAKYTLLNLTNKTVARTMLENKELQARLDGLKKGPQEFIKVDIGGGTTLDGWIIKPPGFDPAKKYPVLFYAYSEPANQTVTDLYTGANYLWYLMLAQQGYIVASVDNRGTPAPRGRAWRKSIYRQLGVLNSKEQSLAVTAMEKTMPYIDASRVGIWGWSGGGSATLNAMFRYPEIYRMGMAVAPGAENLYYDTIYTERYMGLPQDNDADYQAASAKNHATGLKGDLLIVHGTGDDNVHYQMTEYLIDALVAANKPFTMMAYPNRTHSISEGEGTTRHLYELLTRYLHEHLPAGEINAPPK